MTPWLDDGDVRLYHGDCLEVLRGLPDRSVHVCATSPPFYGLRDYGTGSWEGGDPDCDHIIGTDRQDAGRRSETFNGGHATSERYAGRECPRCSARRVDRQIGLEETPDQWVERLVAVFREVRRVLRDDGTLWVEIGDSYAGSWGAQGRELRDGDDQGANGSSRKPSLSGNQIAAAQRKASRTGAIPAGASYKPKDLLGQPWLLAFALRADGWYLRSEIIWARPNPMPESVTDRPTKAHSTVFLLSKQPRYYFDADAIREPHQHDGRRVTQVVGGENSEQHRNGERWPNPTGANARSVWTIPTEPTPFAHFATWPQALVRRMVLAGTSEKGCCPECGAPWVRQVDRPSYPRDETSHRGESQWANGSGRNDGDLTRSGQEFNRWREQNPGTETWIRSCDHALEPVPCTVLDPFAGSATTMLVARNHGRHAVGIELNEAYLEIAAKRLQQLSLLTGTEA